VRPQPTLGRACSPSDHLSYSSSPDEAEGKPKVTQQEEGPKGRLAGRGWRGPARGCHLPSRLLLTPQSLPRRR
jgi:hypothetical protein